MALQATCRAHSLAATHAATRQYQTTALRLSCSSRTRQQARIRRVAASVSYYDTYYAASTDCEEEQGSPTSWHVHHVHKQLPLKSVALGDNGTYVVSFKDGNTAWSAGLPNDLYDTLDEIVNQEGHGIKFVAMGGKEGSETYLAPTGDEVWFVGVYGCSFTARCSVHHLAGK